MAKVAPFRAVAAQDVHHNNDACKTANLIERWNRVAGDGGLPLCKECAALSYDARSHEDLGEPAGSPRKLRAAIAVR